MANVDNIPSSIRHWWIYEFLGALFIIVALLLLSNPAAGYMALVIYFGVLFLIAGIFRIVNSISSREFMRHTGWYTFIGVLDVIIGAWILFNPDYGAAVLPFFVGFLLLFGGLSLIFFGSDVRRLKLGGSVWFKGAGLFCIIVGLLVFVQPVYGAGLTLVWATAGFIAIGIFYIYLGNQIKKMVHIDERGGRELRL